MHPHPQDDLQLSNTTGILQKNNNNYVHSLLRKIPDLPLRIHLFYHNTTNRHMESHIFCEIRLCTNNIVYARLEVFGTFLYIFISIFRNFICYELWVKIRYQLPSFFAQWIVLHYSHLGTQFLKKKQMHLTSTICGKRDC